MKKTSLKNPGVIPNADEISGTTAKRMLAYQIEREMARQNVTRVAMAEKMKTSRAQLNRLLDADNASVTLQTIENAAAALGLRIIIQLHPADKNDLR